MPRTKQPRKRNSSLSADEECDMLRKDFQRQAKIRLHKIESDYDTIFNRFASEVNCSLSKIPPEARKLTLGEIVSFFEERDQEYDDVSSTSEDIPVVVPPSTIKKSKPAKRQTAASLDDGYVTESGAQLKRMSSAEKVTSTTRKSRRSKSSTRTSSRIQKSTLSTGRRGTSTSRVNHLFVTPSVQKSATEFNPVTPKIKPNTPLNILRRPREGEMVLSMQGSPILVSSIVKERTANINVPLGNGDIISLLPGDGLRSSLIPQLDPETLRQLQTLKGHLDKVIDKQ